MFAPIPATQWRKSPCAAAPNRLADSDNLARSRNLEAAIPYYKTAQQRDLRLTFDLGDRAHEWATTAKSPQRH